MKKKISVIFSFKNEEKNLTELIKRITKVLDAHASNYSYELIFVNDSSTDNSLSILLEQQKLFPIVIINLSRTFGFVSGVFAGLDHSNADLLIYMDSDLQDPPELIPELLKKYEDGFDVVHTHRVKRRGENFFKMYLTKKAYKLINFLSDIDLPIEVGDFKLISRRVVDELRNFKEVNPYLRGLSVWIGFKQTIVPYIREPRYSGITHFPLFEFAPLAEMFRGITSFSTKPLLFGIFSGTISVFFSIILSVYILYNKIIGTAVPGSSGIIIAICFFSGVILINLGFIGLYISKIHEQTKKRKRYIVREIIK
jgi:dolichol-phosphate mannosyltransferase